jgi:hypothetical protein
MKPRRLGVGDFGALGLWLWNDGNWSQMSSLNPD